MKRLWKKINRGLVLGGVLLLIMIVFIVIKELQFRSESAEICDTAISSVEALLSLNVEEGETALGEVRDDAVRARQSERLEEMLNEYWDANAESEYYLNMNSVRASYESYLGDPVLVRMYDVELDVPVSSVDVRANGTDYAVVSFEIKNLSAHCVGDGDQIFYGEYYAKGVEDEIPADEYHVSYSGYVEMEMHRTGGEWRVCGMSTWVSVRHKSLVDTEKGGGANG